MYLLETIYVIALSMMNHIRLFVIKKYLNSNNHRFKYTNKECFSKEPQPCIFKQTYINRCKCNELKCFGNIVEVYPCQDKFSSKYNCGCERINELHQKCITNPMEFVDKKCTYCNNVFIHNLCCCNNGYN